MNLSDHATLVATPAEPVTRSLRRPLLHSLLCLSPGAACLVALAALPRFAYAAAANDAHVYAVVTAFSVLVAAAIAASIAAARSRRHARQDDDGLIRLPGQTTLR
jgi:hypothetical protein